MHDQSFNDTETPSLEQCVVVESRSKGDKSNGKNTESENTNDQPRTRRFLRVNHTVIMAICIAKAIRDGQDRVGIETGISELGTRLAEIISAPPENNGCDQVT
jgi:hypothetical protein